MMTKLNDVLGKSLKLNQNVLLMLLHCTCLYLLLLSVSSLLLRSELCQFMHSLLYKNL